MGWSPSWGWDDGTPHAVGRDDATRVFHTRNPIAPAHGAVVCEAGGSFLSSIKKGARGPNSFLNVFCGFEIVRHYRAFCLVHVAVPIQCGIPEHRCFLLPAFALLCRWLCRSFPRSLWCAFRSCQLDAPSAFCVSKRPAEITSFPYCSTLSQHHSLYKLERESFAVTVLQFCAASDAAGTLSVNPHDYTIALSLHEYEPAPCSSDRLADL
jgi:hypothetical protein